MNLVEAMVASAMFVTSSSCSLQLWSSSASWARQAEAQQQQAAKLEAALLASQAQLTALAGTAIAADCTAASSWLAAHLQSMPSGEGLVHQVSAEPGALVRVSVSDANGLERQRWLSPAAYGLCGAQPPEQGDATT
ncbi:hypothetical protein [Cyanobium sp. L1E-Cus]|uniref:hypothetical protein n=1 Tax=Cyanobium sp. L1E-Cus TaxID=2823714 RepID=UPI0020CF21EB|nr:hypothetical protein [Cyanobium sp. L1E-Cus]MCP9823785.1 hypothetical protein [Cyanobium sp. L1E-Cus]